MPVTHKPGDATLPDPDGRPTIIAHVVNDVGAWGRGFVVALAKRYPQVRTAYRKHWGVFKLGDVQWAGPGGPLAPLQIANMFAQRGVTGPLPRVRYGPLRRCLREVFGGWLGGAAVTGAVVHMPRVGCGLGGGDWPTVRCIIEDTAAETGADVVVFGGKQKRGDS